MNRKPSLVFLSAVLFAGILASGCAGSPPISVSLAAASAQTDEGQTVGITATLTNSSQGVNWSLSGPGSLSGQAATSATYNAPAPANGFTSATATITAASVADSTKTASVQIVVNSIPQIAFQTLPGGTVGAPYNRTIALTGGSPPFQWSVYDGPIDTGFRVGGAVPDGLKLDAATGAVTGTPTGGGTWYFDATVTDAAGLFAFNSLSIQISPNGPAGNPVPFLNQPLAPTAVAPGSAGFTLNVSGAGFVSGATIDFNGVPLSTTFADSDHLNATVPAADVASTGTASVTVVNPSPGGGRSNVAYFPVAAPETDVNFANAANSPLQIAEVSDIAVGDFNEDGKPDLAVSGAITVSVLLGNGDGTFTPAPGSPVDLPSPPYDDLGSPLAGVLATGDFNHSGHLGLAVGLFQNEAADILLGKGDGTFTLSSTLANTQGEPTSFLTAADFNGDGNLDLAAVAALTGVTPSILLGYSHGAFNSVAQNVELAASAAVAGDFNGDGKLDLAILTTNVTGEPGTVTILLGNGDGTFMQGPGTPIAVANPSAIAAGDFNGDGKLDLAITDATDNTVVVLLGNGDGTFTPAPGSPISVGANPDAIAVGDLLGNGKLDLAVANLNCTGLPQVCGQGTVTILLGNGDGTFTQASNSPFPVGTAPTSIALADFNGSGRLGLAVTNSGGLGSVSILLQQ